MVNSTGFDVKVAHGAQEIGQEAWDRLSGNHPFASYRWYRFGETVLPDEKPVYIVLSQKGEPVARATFWLARQEPMPGSSGASGRFMEAVMRRWPLLVCHSPLAFTSGLILPEPPSRDAALKTIAQVALEEARSADASFAVLDYLGRQVALEADWPESFLALSLQNPGTYIDIVWPSFDSYVSQLSYKTRKNLRRNWRAADQLGVEIKLCPTVTRVDEALALIGKVDQRYRQQPYPWLRRMMENAVMVDTVWLAAEINGRLMGCELMLGDGDTWLVTALGLDHSVQYVYFRLGYADIQYAIEHGIRRLRWGSCAYKVKQRLGFQAEDNNYVSFAATNRILNWIGRQLARWYARCP